MQSMMKEVYQDPIAMSATNWLALYAIYQNILLVSAEWTF